MTPFGTALIDCNGECGGVAMVGDLNDDLLQDLNDAQAYVEGVLGGDFTPAQLQRHQRRRKHFAGGRGLHGGLPVVE